MDSALFSSFFYNAPVIKVPGRTFEGMSFAIPECYVFIALIVFHSLMKLSCISLFALVSSYYLEDLFEATGHIVEQDSQYAIRAYHQIEKATLWVTSKGGEKHREIVDLQSMGREVSDLYPDYSMPTRLSLDRVDESVLNYDLIEDVLLLILINPEKNSTLVAPDGVDISVGSGQ
jgi:hypothetical protein